MNNIVTMRSRTNQPLGLCVKAVSPKTQLPTLLAMPSVSSLTATPERSYGILGQLEDITYAILRKYEITGRVIAMPTITAPSGAPATGMVITA